MSWLKRQVVMLSTENEAFIFKTEYNTLEYHSKSHKTKYSNELGHHLYFLSDEKIEEGDWCYNIMSKTIFQATKQLVDLINSPNVELTTNKKIIATTDKSLKIQGDDYDTRSKTGREWIFLPQPSQQFVEKYIEEYNKGNVITEVMVEYEEPYSKLIGSKIGSNIGHFTLTKENKCKLKVNSKDNTITIRKIKDSWSREEVESLLFNLAGHYAMLSTKSEISDFNKFIEQNL